MNARAGAAPCTLRELLAYFLRLGTFGFGGPIALAGAMQRDLVEERRWITKDDYVEGLALAQLAPGPLAAQLAMYLGWVRAGVLGATLVSFAFILPSFAMVLALAWLYVRYGGLPWIQGAFYGIGAAVIAIIARSAFKLVRMTVGRDAVLWTIFAAAAAITAWTESEIVWVFLAAGVLALLVKAPPRRGVRAATGAWIPFSLQGFLVTGIHGAASASTLGAIALYFAEAGAFVFGSGLAIVPFLYGGVVERHHWLTERQFLDAVAVAMITPGPVVITVGFIGYLVAGAAGASAAAVGVFLPCYLFVILPAPYFRRFAKNAQLHAFVQGVTAAAAGAIAGAAFVLGKRALVDTTTTLIAVGALALLVKRKTSEPLIILAAGALGLVLSTPGCARGAKEVVVYTSVDQVFSEPIFRAFEKRSGVTVRALYDTEETKSTGVLNRLIAEAARPQADLFWSGDSVRPIVLVQRGLAEPYFSPSAAEIPDAFKANDGSWTGVAARARVLLVNTARVAPGDRPRSIRDLADPRWKGQTAIANPLFGTTTMHVAALFAAWGDERAKAFLTDLKKNDVRVASSNGEVKRLVVSGDVAFGLADTDDAHEALEAKAPVEIVFPDQDQDGVLVMPTSVVLLRGGRHPAEARALADYVLSAECERALAETAAHLPLRGDVTPPSGVRRVSDLRVMAVDPARAADEMLRIEPWLREWVGL